jgi:hypothetical protein
MPGACGVGDGRLEQRLHDAEERRAGADRGQAIDGLEQRRRAQ